MATSRVLAIPRRPAVEVMPKTRLARALVKGLPFPTSGWSSASWVSYQRGDVALSGARDPRLDVGDGSETSIVESCVNWIMRSFPEAPPAAWRLKRDGTRDRIDDDPLVALIKRPNVDPKTNRSAYSGSQLMMATLASWTIDGNAYWLKVRQPSDDRVVALWYIPHWMIEPVGSVDGSTYLTKYRYNVLGRQYDVPVERIVHFRFGIDRDNVLKGMSPLRGVLRDVALDEMCSRFTAAMIRNRGVPGIVISPTQDDGISGPEADAIKLAYVKKFTGDHAGEPLVLEGPVNVDTFGFSPADMDLSALRNLAEERVTAALGFPAAVVGFGAGLEEAHTNATMRELREQAWESNLIPTGRELGETIHEQLGPDFYGPAELALMEHGFDLSHVRVLQDDENKKVERTAKLYDSAIITRGEARSAHDLKSTKADDVFKQKIAEELVPRETDVRDEPPAPVVDPNAPPAPTGPTPEALAAAETAKRVQRELGELRVALIKLAAEPDRSEDDVKKLVDAYDRSAAARDERLVDELHSLVDAFKQREPSSGTRQLIHRDAKGNIEMIDAVPMPAATGGAT